MGLYHRVVDSFLRTPAGGWTALHVMNPVDKRLMRWSNGRLSTGIGTDFHRNGVLLVCTGAKSGQKREIPLLATPLEGNWVLIASRAGAEKHPSWYHNLKAQPSCSLIVPGRGEVACVAHEAEGAERESAWQAANNQYGGYTVYQGRTHRRIPVMVLVPAR